MTTWMNHPARRIASAKRFVTRSGIAWNWARLISSGLLRLSRPFTMRISPAWALTPVEQDYLLPALTFPHRFLAAALMLASPCGEMRRLLALIGTIFWPFCFAQRARCAAAIRLRAAADIVRPVVRVLATQRGQSIDSRV